MTEKSLVSTLPRRAQTCFAGIFNGAQKRAWLTPGGGLCIGKSECEWDWEESWGALRDAGLVEWALEERANHPDEGGSTTYFVWSITEKGYEARKEDLRIWREKMDALDADDAA